MFWCIISYDISLVDHNGCQHSGSSGWETHPFTVDVDAPEGILQPGHVNQCMSCQQVV